MSFYTIEMDGDGGRYVNGPYPSKNAALDAAEARMAWNFKHACVCIRKDNDLWEQPFQLVKLVGEYKPNFSVSTWLKEVKP
jgi:hypothetical protein